MERAILYHRPPERARAGQFPNHRGSSAPMEPSSSFFRQRRADPRPLSSLLPSMWPGGAKASRQRFQLKYRLKSLHGTGNETGPHGMGTLVSGTGCRRTIGSGASAQSPGGRRSGTGTAPQRSARGAAAGDCRRAGDPLPHILSQSGVVWFRRLPPQAFIPAGVFRCTGLKIECSPSPRVFMPPRILAPLTSRRLNPTRRGAESLVFAAQTPATSVPHRRARFPGWPETGD